LGNHKNNSKKMSTWKHSLMVALGTFFFAILISISSQVFLTRFNSLIFPFIFLLIIILIGIIFDIIGIAATAANEAPFHARASRRLMGAKHSIWLVRNADKVASFCNDVVGDICGTVSGAIAASIVFNLTRNADKLQLIAGTIMTGIVAALTVGGKALGKSAAITKSDYIIQWVGQTLAWFGYRLGKKKYSKRRK
jgi:Mg2+/Co2+ transporter CorB